MTLTAQHTTLFVNHTGLVSGAERSMLDLLQVIAGMTDVQVACPPGPLAGLAERRGAYVWDVRAVEMSLAMPIHRLPAAGASLAAVGLAVRRAVRRGRADLVHANSERAGLVAAVARGVGGPPFVVHARDVLPGLAGSAIRATLGRAAAAVIANSEYTAAGWRKAARNVTVAHSPVDMSRFDPDATAPAPDLVGKGPLLVQIAQITPWKGQMDAIRALERLRRMRPDVRLALVGEAKFVGPEVRHDNAGYERRLREVARDLGPGAVLFLGERDDVPAILKAADLALLPSWQEPFGRSVVEAMAMGVPVLATAVGGPAEILTDGVEGRLLPPRDPDAWARAIAELLDDPERCAALGTAGRASARRFTPSVHADAVLRVHREVIAARRGSPRRWGRSARRPSP